MPLQLRDSYPGGQRLSDEPLVHLYDDYLSEEEIRHLMLVAAPQLQRALVSDGSEGAISADRTNRNCWIQHHHDQVISRLCLRISTLVGLPLNHAEALQVIHYGVSQEYAPHYDAWDHDTDTGTRCMSRGGQRLLTCLLYFNDVTAGGGTGFPNLDLEVRARKGRMLVFHNCLAGSNIKHPNSLHGGLPVMQGEKWACNLWFREHPFQTGQHKDALGYPVYGRVV